MAQAPTASVATENNRRDAAAAILLGYDDTDLATVLTSARNNGFPQLGNGTNQIANVSVNTGIIGGVNR